jgi:hypothetical protein
MDPERIVRAREDLAFIVFCLDMAWKLFLVPIILPLAWLMWGILGVNHLGKADNAANNTWLSLFPNGTLSIP